MTTFNFSIRAFVFSVALLIGTTAFIASRFVITTVAGFATPAAVPESVTISTSEPENAAIFEDLRNEEPIAPENFDPTGVYSPDIEKVPAAFKDIELIQIATREYEEKDGIYSSNPIVPVGTLEMINKSFSFTKIAIGNREMSFETNTQNGVSYQFTGDFQVSTESINCEECEYPPDLKGTLKKLKNGKVIAEMDAQFYAVGC